jgi:hypothetical protein
MDDSIFQFQGLKNGREIEFNIDMQDRMNAAPLLDLQAMHSMH